MCIAYVPVKLHAEKATTTMAIYEIASAKGIEGEGRKDIAGAASFVHTINTNIHLRMTVCVCIVVVVG